jgi:hypothetical protein
MTTISMEDEMWLASSDLKDGSATCVASLRLDIDGMIAESGCLHLFMRCRMRSEEI